MNQKNQEAVAKEIIKHAKALTKAMKALDYKKEYPMFYERDGKLALTKEKYSMRLEKLTALRNFLGPLFQQDIPNLIEQLEAAIQVEEEPRPSSIQVQVVEE